jgi:cytochrome c oxidase subunit 2
MSTTRANTVRARTRSAGAAMRARRPASLVTGAWLLAGCAGPQSALDPAGRGAEALADLFWILAAGAGVIWLAATVLWIRATGSPERPFGARSRRLVIVGGGVVLPAALLAVVLSWSLAMLPDFLAPAPAGSLRIEVIGHQWWWRVRYLREGAEPVELANEIRLPVNQPVQIELESRDVIHSFWIPSLAGKMDMIPGRRTSIRLEPTRVGTYLGPCAEYCGTSQAEAFAEWLSGQARPAAAPTQPRATHGRDVFFAHGCGACHAVRGTPADGVIGPDLTHVGSRLSIGAGVLDNDTTSFRRWLTGVDELKPGAHMPAFGMLPGDALDALAAYLEGLQ